MSGMEKRVLLQMLSHVQLENMSGMDAYLCGPPIMIETACDALSKGGVKGTDIAYDEF